MQFAIQRHLAPIVFCAAFAAVASTAAKSASKAVIVPGTQYEVRIGQDVVRSFTTPRGDALLGAIVIWLSANFDLPVSYSYPRIEVVPLLKLAGLRYRGLISDRNITALASSDAMQLNIGRDIVAIYDDGSKTIYLPEGWTGATPADLSVLVHEMAHHLQNVAGLKYACAEEREQPAYAAQEQWLHLFGRNLADEFDVDGLTILIRTHCMI